MQTRRVVDYLERTTSHWVSLAGGVAIGTLGFLSGAVDLRVPAWVFWILAGMFVSFAQYRAYADAQRDLEALQVTLANEQRRYEESFSTSRYSLTVQSIQLVMKDVGADGTHCSAQVGITLSNTGPAPLCFTVESGYTEIGGLSEEDQPVFFTEEFLEPGGAYVHFMSPIEAIPVGSLARGLIQCTTRHRHASGGPAWTTRQLAFLRFVGGSGGLPDWSYSLGSPGVEAIASTEGAPLE